MDHLEPFLLEYYEYPIDKNFENLLNSLSSSINETSFENLIPLMFFFMGFGISLSLFNFCDIVRHRNKEYILLSEIREDSNKNIK